jgi:hypothetical protein
MTGTGSKALAMMALSVVIMTGGQAQTASKGREDGIHVHGYWTIKVSEPDGKIVRHVEFENSLAQNTGGAFLMALLTGQSTASSLAIGLVAHFGQGGAISAICNHVTYFDWNLDYGCAIASSGGQFYASCIDVNGCFTGLTVTLPTATLSNNQWVISGITLSGQMTAEASATIAGVMSLFLTCTNGVCPTDRISSDYSDDVSRQRLCAGQCCCPIRHAADFCALRDIELWWERPATVRHPGSRRAVGVSFRDYQLPVNRPRWRTQNIRRLRR